MSKIPDTTAEIRVALDGLSWGDAVKLIHEWLHPLPPPGSARVRIAVGFDQYGEWSSFGWEGAKDEELREDATDDGWHRIVFIEADIPAPVTEPVVAGRVVDVE